MKNIQIVLKHNSKVITVPADNYRKSYRKTTSKNLLDFIFASLETKELFKLFWKEENGNLTDEEILEKISIKNTPFSVDDIRTGILGCIYTHFGKKMHKCGENCDIETFFNCTKVYDKEKKGLEEYPFIQNAFQVIINGELERFVVINCKDCPIDVMEERKDKAMQLAKLQEVLIEMRNNETISPENETRSLNNKTMSPEMARIRRLLWKK